jgi:3-oxoacyl-[acyl-carrier protein] reductase
VQFHDQHHLCSRWLLSPVIVVRDEKSGQADGVSTTEHGKVGAMERFAGRRVLVTGGSRGIGAAVVRRLADEGAQVVINYRTGVEPAEKLAAELRAAGGVAHTVAGDVADPAAITRLVDEAADRLGGLDVLISNAGVEHFGGLEEITPADFDRIFHINVRGQLLVTQAAMRHLGEGARIVLTSSISAYMGVYQHTLYAASKAAVAAMVQQLSVELSDRGIAINAIAPGGTQTDMADSVATKYLPHRLEGVSAQDYFGAASALGRLAEPAEIAAVVAFLASADAGYITGRTLQADGGYL